VVRGGLRTAWSLGFSGIRGDLKNGGEAERPHRERETSVFGGEWGVGISSPFPPLLLSDREKKKGKKKHGRIFFLPQ